MVDGRIQAFPRDDWEREFTLAAEVGYDTMELTIEMASYDIHPVSTPAGRDRIRQVSRDTGIALAGLCCDVFMERPLTAAADDARESSADMLVNLIRACGELNLPMIEIPAMGDNSLKHPAARDRAQQVLESALPLAENAAVDVILESDLAPADLAAFMDQVDHPRLGINYDTGNSTWFGFDPDDELPRYHHHVRNIHIKDCTVKDYSVPLGQGETRFDRVFALLRDFEYNGDFVMQAARQDDDLKAGRDYLAFTRKLVTRWLQ
ncbi:MAG: sugar phosphate isomerase/epimerase family protein [Rhodospirillales bacterium]